MRMISTVTSTVCTAMHAPKPAAWQPTQSLANALEARSTVQSARAITTSVKSSVNAVKTMWA